jgi:hypothetical protein
VPKQGNCPQQPLGTSISSNTSLEISISTKDTKNNYAADPVSARGVGMALFCREGVWTPFYLQQNSNGLLGKEKKRSTAYLQYCTYLRKKLLIWAGRSIFQNTGLETEWIIGLQIWRPILVIPAPPPPFQTQMWGVLRGSLFVPPSIPSFTTNPLLNH